MSLRKRSLLLMVLLAAALPAIAWQGDGDDAPPRGSRYYRPILPTRPFFESPYPGRERSGAWHQGYQEGYRDGYIDRDLQSRHPYGYGYGYDYGGYDRGAGQWRAYRWSNGVGSRARDGYRARSGGGEHHSGHH